MISYISLFFFFFNDTATTEIYTLSLHDALPISLACLVAQVRSLDLRLLLHNLAIMCLVFDPERPLRDRKSTRLNSSHLVISYAVFCLKKKKSNQNVVLHTISEHVVFFSVA